MKLRLSAASKLGAMSGWVPSMPVSSTPTSTRLSPGSTLYEPGGCGVDHRHVPLQAAEGIGSRNGLRLRLRQLDAGPLGRAQILARPPLAHGGGVVADGLVPRDAGHGALAEQVGGERRAGRRRRRDADAPVLGDEESACCAHGEPRRGEGCAVLVEDDVTLGGSDPLRCGGSRRDDGCERRRARREEEKPTHGSPFDGLRSEPRRVYGFVAGKAAQPRSASVARLLALIPFSETVSTLSPTTSERRIGEP